MPRLTNSHYLRLHHSFRQLWLADRAAYGRIRTEQQRTLHRFLAPSKDLTNEALLEHRRQATADEPNLPHQAGRVLQAIREGATTEIRVTDGHRHLVLHAVARPEPDLRKMIAALKAFPLRPSAGAPTGSASPPDHAGDARSSSGRTRPPHQS